MNKKNAFVRHLNTLKDAWGKTKNYLNLTKSNLKQTKTFY